MLKVISGGVCAAQGFKAAGIHCGVKASSKPDKNDVAMILSDAECTAAGTYTLNRVKAAPLYVTMSHLENGVAWGVIANSGNANACCPLSHENAEAMCAAAAKVTGHDPEDFVVASTGVIGQTINVGVIEAGLPALAEKLNYNGSDDAAAAIMTTDLVPKNIAVSFTVGGKEVKMGAIAKGSGMIHPNMGTMLGFITTDCAITQELLEDALRYVVTKTFNRVTVDGDTSTNDMCVILANGLAGNELIEWKDEDYHAFQDALEYICRYLARCIAADGEGATKLITCKMHGARSEESAERLAKSVVGSSLVKAAMFGADANWGRVLCAIGYSGAAVDVEKIDVSFRSKAGTLDVCRNGAGIPFSEEFAKEVLTEKEIEILVELNSGDAASTAWGCDLTYEYVKINGDYRT
jgi:glutamate N-acetyltransferase/amino-acid N-acetyltransferase